MVWWRSSEFCSTWLWPSQPRSPDAIWGDLSCAGGWLIPSGNLLHSYGKSPFLVGKSTISISIFNSYVTNYQRVSKRKDLTSTWDFCHKNNIGIQLRIRPFAGKKPSGIGGCWSPFESHLQLYIMGSIKAWLVFTLRWFHIAMAATENRPFFDGCRSQTSQNGDSP